MRGALAVMRITAEGTAIRVPVHVRVELKEVSLELCDEILAFERRVWDALVRGDTTADQRALSPDFMGVYPSGFASRADHVAQLNNGPSIQSYEISQAKVIALGVDYVVLSYLADFQRVDARRSEMMYVSSIWQRDQRAGWCNIFSQDTPVAEPQSK